VCGRDEDSIDNKMRGQLGLVGFNLDSELKLNSAARLRVKYWRHTTHLISRDYARPAKLNIETLRRGLKSR
jgi:hypothetical protein